MSKIYKKCLLSRIHKLETQQQQQQEQQQQLTVTKTKLYSDIYVWAEESGATSANNAEWSYGNGATGFIGLKLPHTTDLELVGVSFHADNFSPTATISVDVVDYSSVASGAAPVLGNITLANSVDGDGTTNNAHKYGALAAPVSVPSGAVLGFITRTELGAISDARVLAHLRKFIGDVVTGVEYG